MPLDAEASHGDHKHHKRQRSQHRREQPGVCGVVALRPRRGEWRGSIEDDRYDSYDTENDDRGWQAATTPGWLWWVMLARRSERRLFGQHRSSSRRLCGVGGIAGVVSVVRSRDKVFDGKPRLLR
jgi:hypothetical protein